MPSTNGRNHNLHLISVIVTSKSGGMEANIIAEVCQLSEQMHGVRYLWFIRDGDSSMFQTVVTSRAIVTVFLDSHKKRCNYHLLLWTEV